MDSTKFPSFSVYPRGHKVGSKAVPENRPCKEVTLLDVYEYIIHDPDACKATHTLRNLHFGHRNGGEFKLLNFETATFSCTCTYRKQGFITKVNNLLVLDFDEVGTKEALLRLRSSLLHDDCFDTQLLFISPSGNGIKWVIEIDDWNGMKREDYFRSLSNYICHTHHHTPDPSGKDVTRLCFLPHDPQCYINPKYLEGHE